MINKQYFKDYYTTHKHKIKKRQKNYYYTKTLHIPPQFIPAYKKHKTILKHLHQLDDETIQFFKEYYKQH